MIRNFLTWLNQPLGRVAVLIVALTLFSIVAYEFLPGEDVIVTLK